MKKITKLLFTLLILVGLGLIVGCSSQLGKSDKIEEQAYMNTISAQAVSAVNLVNVSNIPARRARLSQTNDALPNYDMHRMLEGIIDQGMIMVSDKLNLTSKKSDLIEFDYLVEVNYDGGLYLIYFKNLTQRVEIEEDDGEKEEEYTFTYNGVVKHNDIEYTFEAIEEVEIEGNEEESEIEFRLNLSETKKVIIKQEFEEETFESESEFKYKLVENGKTTFSYSLERETKLGKEEVKCKMNGVEFKLEYKERTKKVILKTNDFKCELSVDAIDDALIASFVNELLANGAITNPNY